MAGHGRTPPLNVHRLLPEDEAALREHHAAEGGYDRCVICRLLATLDYERDSWRSVNEVLNSGDGTYRP